MGADDEPLLARLVHAGGEPGPATPIAPGIFVSPGVSNAHLLTTPDGDVALNAGLPHEGPRHRERFAAVSDAPLRWLVLTQGHLDHIGGAAALVGPGTRVVAHEDFPVVRGYWNRLAAFYARRTAVLWKDLIDRIAVPGSAPPADPVPDLLVGERHTLVVGGRRLELHAVPGGETTDALAVFLPDEGVVFTGNLFGPIFGHLPNLYTIRGDKIRSALGFVASLERVQGLDADLLVTGHGEPVRGREAIRAGLGRIRRAVLWIHDRTVQGMNAGKDVHTLMREIELPSELCVGQGHGKTSWCVRAIWEEYAGWFHHDSTAALYPVPRSAVHTDLVELAGADALAARAADHLEAGRPVEALHLSDVVLDAEPGHRGALAVRLGALERLLERAGGENFSEVRWLRGRIADARAALGP